jgi:hypothetical protein
MRCRVCCCAVTPLPAVSPLAATTPSRIEEPAHSSDTRLQTTEGGEEEARRPHRWIGLRPRKQSLQLPFQRGTPPTPLSPPPPTPPLSPSPPAQPPPWRAECVRPHRPPRSPHPELAPLEPQMPLNLQYVPEGRERTTPSRPGITLPRLRHHPSSHLSPHSRLALPLSPG